MTKYIAIATVDNREYERAYIEATDDTEYEEVIDGVHMCTCSLTKIPSNLNIFEILVLTAFKDYVYHTLSLEEATDMWNNLALQGINAETLKGFVIGLEF